MKTSDDIKKRLSELDADRKAAAFEIKAELTATRAEIAALTEKRDNAESPEAYKHLTADIKDKEAYASFLEARKEKIDTPPLSKEECNAMIEILNKELETTAAKTAQGIEKAIPGMYKLMQVYFEAFDSFNKIYKEALRLSGKACYTGANLDRLKIAGNTDNNIILHFYQFCANEYDREEREKLEAVRMKALKKIYAAAPARVNEYQPGVYVIGGLDE